MKTEIFLCCFHFVTFHQGKTQQMPPIIRDIEREEVNGFGFSNKPKRQLGIHLPCLPLLKIEKEMEKEREAEHYE